MFTKGSDTVTKRGKWGYYRLEVLALTRRSKLSLQVRIFTFGKRTHGGYQRVSASLGSLCTPTHSDSELESWLHLNSPETPIQPSLICLISSLAVTHLSPLVYLGDVLTRICMCIFFSWCSKTVKWPNQEHLTYNLIV